MTQLNVTHTNGNVHLPRYPMSAYPSGWYAVIESRELLPGAVHMRSFMGREIVMFRTQSGLARVIDAHCPHLGAHLGYYGTVQGEELRCGFHGFRFACEGACTATGYDTRPPPRAVLATWPVIEQDGMVLVWFHPTQREPTWQPPAPSWSGWSTPRSWLYKDLRTHAQDMTENSVDTGHFFHAHGFRDLQSLEPLQTDGPVLRSRYRFKRPENPRTGKGRIFDATTTIEAWGMGFTLAEAEVVDFGLRTRVIVYHTPTRDGRIDVWVRTSLRSVERPGVMHPVLGMLPQRAVDALLEWQIHRYVTSDIQGDFPYLENKRFLERPALAEGDGPIMKFRSWTRQFYEDTPRVRE